MEQEQSRTLKNVTPLISGELMPCCLQCTTRPV